MIRFALAVVTTLSPMLVIALLLALADWRDRRRAMVVSRQVQLSDAIARELGAVVAPVVRKPLGGRWRIEMALPPGRPALVAHVVEIVRATMAAMAGPSELVLVLAPGPAPGGPVAAPRRLRAA
jgi:hypothetical protein